MDVDSNGNVRRAAAWRKRRAEAGESQVTVWLDADQVGALDGMISAGLFRNRSEAVAQAVRKFDGQKET